MSKTKKHFFLLLNLLGCCLQLPALDLVKDGKPQAEIVVSDQADAEVMLAARDLQENLEKISGARLEIVSEPQDVNSVALCVGESETSRDRGYVPPQFTGSAYDIWIKDNCVVLNGPSYRSTKATPLEERGLHAQNRFFTLEGDHLVNEKLHVSLDTDCGPMHAVSAFLEKLGVRFYGPNEEDVIRPQLRTVSVAEGRETRTAAFSRREYQYGNAQVKDADGVRWLKRLKGGTCTERIGMLALSTILLEDYGTQDQSKPRTPFHPEWLARNMKGDLLTSADCNAVPKYLNAGFQEACLKRIREIFDATPELNQLILVPPLCINGWDACDWQKAYRDDTYFQPLDRDITIAFFIQLAEELAKTHPEKKLLWQSTAANGMFTQEYLPEKMPKNLGATANHYAAINYSNPKIRQLYLQETQDLRNVFPQQKFQQREWWNEFADPNTPRQVSWFTRGLQEVRQTQKKLEFEGFLMDLAPAENGQELAELPLTHLMIYLNSKLLWNPELDLEALLNEYLTLYYGPASADMRRFLFFAESIVNRGKSRSFRLHDDAQLRPDDVPVFFDLLNQAKAAVEPDSLYYRRIKRLEDSLSWMKTAFAEREAQGEILVAEVLPVTATCDGDLTKYRNWLPLLLQASEDGNSGNRTEIAVALNEDRQRLMLAFRCYEKDMDRLKNLVPKERDDAAILDEDHVLVQFFSAQKSGFRVAVNPDGAIFDASADPADVGGGGTPFTDITVFEIDGRGYATSCGWNPPLTTSHVKHLDDRWEVELCINIQGCGKTLGKFPPWGLQVTRSRITTADQKVELQSLAKPGADGKTTPTAWRQLVLPDRNAAGEKLSKYNDVAHRLPGIESETFYLIKRTTNQQVEFCQGWDTGAWHGVQEIRLGYELYNINRTVARFIPDARAKLIYDDNYLYIQYQVKDRFVIGGIKQDQDQVCTDSCMEFFIRPNCDKNYFNFECNCTGTMLLYRIAIKQDNLSFYEIPQEELQKIQRFHSLPRPLKGEITEPVTWYLGLKIPLAFFVNYADVTLPLTGQVWGGNVFKCADRTSNPVWLMWYPSQEFHDPWNFGKFIFE